MNEYKIASTTIEEIIKTTVNKETLKSVLETCEKKELIDYILRNVNKS